MSTWLSLLYLFIFRTVSSFIHFFMICDSNAFLIVSLMFLRPFLILFQSTYITFTPILSASWFVFSSSFSFPFSDVLKRLIMPSTFPGQHLWLLFCVLNSFLSVFQILQNLGKADRTVDEVFDEFEVNFAQQQTNANRLHKEVANYLRCCRGWYFFCSTLPNYHHFVYSTPVPVYINSWFTHVDILYSCDCLAI